MDDGALPSTPSEERDSYTSAYAFSPGGSVLPALSQSPPEPRTTKPTTLSVHAPTAASNDAMLLAFERARLSARCVRCRALCPACVALAVS